MPARVREMAVDILACGVDPERATLFVQSAVPEHTELAWALASVTPYGELGRMTQFKDKAEHQPDNINAGLFTYPILQAADILLYGATRVPVGEDQRQHLELAREIVRRWNARFGETFPEPQPLFTTTPKILGLDGQAKMSKSLGNTISLREDDKAIWDKLRTAATDPARAQAHRPGHPREVQRLHAARVLLDAGRAAGRARGLHDGRHRLHRLQEAAVRGARRPTSRAFARAPTSCARSRSASTRSSRRARRGRGPWRARRWRACGRASGSRRRRRERARASSLGLLLAGLVGAAGLLEPRRRLEPRGRRAVAHRGGARRRLPRRLPALRPADARAHRRSAVVGAPHGRDARPAPRGFS